MFEEKFEKEGFPVNRGRDAFIDRILIITDSVTEGDIDGISELLEYL